jgi:ABC-type lipoprotein export system ATPase subunit
VVVTHSERVAAAADRVVELRDGRAAPWPPPSDRRPVTAAE